MLTNAPKGTKDMLPQDAYKWKYVRNAFADICAKYGFKQITTPVFEHTELFKRGVGDTTDIVQKEMYTFTDFGNRSITLRPEGTSPVARSFVEHKAMRTHSLQNIFMTYPASDTRSLSQAD